MTISRTDFNADTQRMLDLSRDLTACRKGRREDAAQLQAYRNHINGMGEPNGQSWFEQVPSWAWVGVGIVVAGATAGGVWVGWRLAGR